MCTVGQALFLFLFLLAVPAYASHSLECPTATQQASLDSLHEPLESSCLPSTYDGVGMAIYSCLQHLELSISGCQVEAKPAANPTQAMEMPCEFFGLQGNLTEDGTSANVWVTADARGLWEYFTDAPEMVDNMQYNSPESLLTDIWAFLRIFFTDERFNKLDLLEEDEQGALRLEGTRELVSLSKHKRQSSSMYRHSRHKVTLKTPEGCKYKYKVDASSPVFANTHKQKPEQLWRVVYLTVACFSVLATTVGLGFCMFFSKKHCEYLQSHYDLEQVKEHLIQEQPAVWAKLFADPHAASPPRREGLQTASPTLAGCSCIKCSLTGSKS